MIRGALTRLRPLAEGDLGRVLRWRNAVRHNFRDDRELSMDDQRAWFARYATDASDQCFVIETLDGDPIGLACVYAIDAGSRTAEFGRLILGEPEHAGRGYASDASRALIGHAFGELGLTRLYLDVLDTNEPALRLYDSLGFVLDEAHPAEVLPSRGSLRRMVLERDRWETA